MKILIISHNTFSETNNVGKTLKGWFSNSDHQLYNFYIRKLPGDETDEFKDVLCYTDFDALRQVFCLKTKHIINKVDVNDHETIVSNTNKQLSKNKFFSKNRFKVKHALRNLIWDISRSKKIIVEWVSYIKPDIIFFTPGYASFLYDIVNEIHRELKIPIYTYFFDDYLNYKASFFSKLIYNFRLNNSIKEICDISVKTGYISSSMEKKYEKSFNLNKTETLMTPTSLPVYLNDKSYKITEINLSEPLRIYFIGNVSVGRLKTLELFSRAVYQLQNEGFNLDYRVYSFNLSESEIKTINFENEKYFYGSLDSEEVRIMIDKADVLLHVESFDSKFIQEVKHSFSTKLADYLSSSAAILAVGPENLFSINYLQESYSAETVTENSLELIKKSIQKLTDSDYRLQLVKNSIKLANLNHNSQLNRKKLNESLECIIYEKK